MHLLAVVFFRCQISLSKKIPNKTEKQKMGQKGKEGEGFGFLYHPSAASVNV